MTYSKATLSVVCFIGLLAYTTSDLSAARTEIYVAPNGKLGGTGARESPISLRTAFTDAWLVTPGATVWVAGGRYEVGALKQDKGLHGTKEAPIIIRAMPGERATIVGEITLTGDYIWLWGLEVTGPPGSGVEIRGGNGLKLINMILHDNGAKEKPKQRRPTGMGIGAWAVGDDHEFYGNIIYHNGCNTLDHGIYSQNTAKYTAKRYIDNIIFENAGCGFHIYGQSPTLCGFHVEGNICFATSLHPRYPSRGQMNILVGGHKPLSNLLLKSNCTYHPQLNSKRGVDVGYTAKGNKKILIEDNYFTCGAHAMELKGVAEAVVRNNTFWSAAGMVLVSYAPDADKSDVVWKGNTYIDNGKFDLGKWQAHTGTDSDAKVLQGRNGRPTGLFIFKRVNKFEPRRVHLAIYNWDHLDAIHVDLEGILRAGDRYRVVNVLDYFGRPVAAGRAKGAFIKLPMKGHRYEPEFGAYVLFVRGSE